MSMTSSIVTEKRLRNEMKELLKNKLEFAQAIQDENDKFIFYFLLKGDKDSDYNGGYYIGKIMLPQEYPAKAGDFMMLTPNGRFTINAKICLTNSGYHSESWTPIWNIKNMIIGFSSIFNTDLEHGISHIKDTPYNRRKFAEESVGYNLSFYKNIFIKFDQFVNPDGTIKVDQTIIEDKPPKKKNKDTVIVPINNKEEGDNIIVEKSTVSLKTKTSVELINEYLEKIKHMPFQEFDIELYTKVNELISGSLSEM
jgi:ubiquitin-protein ligase